MMMLALRRCLWDQFSLLISSVLHWYYLPILSRLIAASVGLFALQAGASPVTVSVGDTLGVNFSFAEPFSQPPTSIEVGFRVAAPEPLATRESYWSLYNGTTLIQSNYSVSGEGINSSGYFGSNSLTDFSSISRSFVNGYAFGTLLPYPTFPSGPPFTFDPAAPGSTVVQAWAGNQQQQELGPATILSVTLNGSTIWTAGSTQPVIQTPPSVSTLANLSNDVYTAHLGAEGYQVEPNGIKTGADGFAATVYKNSSTNQVVIAVRGTDTNDGIGVAAYNWLANGSLAPGGTADALLVSYTKQLADLLKSVEQSQSDSGASITLTGHSLGGAVAQVVGSAVGVAVTSFDAPGAKDVFTATDLKNIKSQFSGISINTPSTTITNYRLQGDEVSLIGMSGGVDSQFGSTVTVPNPNKNFNVWDLGANHNSLTLATQIASLCPLASSSGCQNGSRWINLAIKLTILIISRTD